MSGHWIMLLLQTFSTDQSMRKYYPLLLKQYKSVPSAIKGWKEDVKKC